jgi:hypothetical protein
VGFPICAICPQKLANRSFQLDRMASAGLCRMMALSIIPRNSSGEVVAATSFDSGAAKVVTLTFKKNDAKRWRIR